MNDELTKDESSIGGGILLGVGALVAFLFLRNRPTTNSPIDDGNNPYSGMSQQDFLNQEPNASTEPTKWAKWVAAAGVIFGAVEKLFGPGGPFHKPKGNAAQNEFILGTVNRQFGLSFNSASSPWRTGQFGAFQFGNFGGFGNTIPGGQFGNTTFPNGGFNPFPGFGFG